MTAIVYILHTGAKGGGGFLNDFLLAIGFGLITASILALSTVALSLQFSVTNIPNFAHGEIMTAGAYGAWVTQSVTHNVFLAGVVACVMGGVLALFLNSAILAPFARSGAKRLVLFILTIASGLVLQHVILLIFGGANLPYSLPSSPARRIGPFILTDRSLAIIGAAVVVMVGVHLILRYTKFGKAQRAVADSRELARVSGIDSALIVRLTWLMAGAMGGLAGFVLGVSIGSLTPTLGYTFLLVVFAAAIVGGIGKPYGAMLGALLIGLAMEVSALYLPSDYKLVVAFAFLIVTLLIRPSGLFPSFQGARA
ncbi:MAG TPA: branched-chain amino acid ABC transporter permease [Chloroflexota bacterium]|nr:branched-chain amino acid ABC transporter permease [Chloroflexota bacterium]